MTRSPDSESGRSTVGPVLASTGEILYWGVAFYVAHLPWLLAAAAPPAASRVAFTLWQDRLPGLGWTAVELVAAVFRLGLAVVVVGLARGTGETIPGFPVDWLPDVKDGIGRSFGHWQVVVGQLLILALVFLVVNAGITHAAVPWLASFLGDEGARAAAFAFENLVGVPLFVTYLYAVFVRQFA